MVLDYKGRNDIGNWTCINYLQYVLSRWGLCTPSMLRAGYPTLLTWRGRYNLTRLKTSRWLPHVVLIVTECLLTRSMLIKMYVYAIYSRFRIEAILSIRKHGYAFITTLSLSSLMSPFSLSCPPLSCWCLTHSYVRARLSIHNLRLPLDRTAILIGRLSHLAMISSSRGFSI